jgi:phosphoglycolate phosphatase
MFEAVIFDLDGTILNTLDDLADSANHVLSENGYRTYPTEQYKTFVGNGIPKLIERILPQDVSEAVFERVLAEFRVYYGEHKNDKTAPYRGIPEMLAELKNHGLKICVLSNKQHDLSVEIVKHHFGNDTFDLIRGKMEQFPAKPDPASCNDVISILNITKRNILYVGDSNVDMQTGANAGLVKCGVSWGFRSVEELKSAGADYIARTPQDILKIALGE